MALALLASVACEFGRADTAELPQNASAFSAVTRRHLDGARVATSEAGGTTVVRTLNAAWDAGRNGWTIEQDARLKIGAPRGDDDSEALWRVESAVLGPDRKVFVANEGSLEIKAFSSDGRLLWVAGGQGMGPGEFQSFAGLYWCSDSLVVTDLQTRRITRLNVDGEVAETMPWRRLQRGTTPNSFHCNSTGTVARIEREFELPDAPGPHSVAAWLASGTVSETPAILGRVGQFDRFRLASGDMPADLGRDVLGAAGDQVVHVLVRDAPVILTYDLKGRLVRRAEWGYERKVVTSEMLENEAEYLSRILSRSIRAQFIADWLDLKHPNVLPVLVRIIVATNGDLWIKQFRLTMEESNPELWWIVSANGALRGIIQIPVGFELLWVGDDTVLGLTEDEERNHYVELRALMKKMP